MGIQIEEHVPNDLQAMMALAYNEATETGLYFIHTGHMVKAMFAADSKAAQLIRGVDKEQLFTAIDNMYRGLEPEQKQTNIPLTIEMEDILKHSSRYRKATGERYNTSVHFLMALLSFDNSCQSLFSLQGYIYPDFAEAYAASVGAAPVQQIKPSIPTEPGKPGFPPKWILFLCSAKKKKAIALEVQEKAGWYFRHGNLERCRACCEYLLLIDKNSFAAKAFLADCLQQEKKYELAAEAYEKLTGAYPDNINTWHNYCYALSCLKDDAKTDRSYEEAIKRFPASTHLLNNWGFYKLEQAHYETAIELFNKAIAADPLYAYPYNNRGFCRVKLGQYEPAQQDIMHSLTLDAGNSYAYKNMGVFFIAKGDKKQAQEWLQKALRYGFSEKYGTEAADLLQSITSQETGA